MPRKLIFAFMATPGSPELEALTLAKSIRAFAGKLADSPIWILVPGAEDSLSAQSREETAALDARLLPFQIAPEALKFPFAAKVYASAEAETQAQGQTDLLLWMDSASIIINEPGELLLAGDKSVGDRPVQHTLVGSNCAGPLD